MQRQDSFMRELSHSESSPSGKSEEPPSKKGPINLSDLRPRVVSALVLVAAALATLYAGGKIFAIFWLLASCAILWEWEKLIGGARFTARLVMGGAALAAAAAFAGAGAAGFALLVLAAGAAIAAVLAQPGRRLWAAGGVLYAGVLVVSVCLLRESPKTGALAIAWLFALVWGTDVFAYFGGRIVGGPKLWTRISAGKTWSGALIGVFSGALLGLAVLRWGGAVGSSWPPLFAIGLVGAILAQIGDLFESAVKRSFGVKDSSRLIPGHGGVMDRLDGFIFASAFAALVGVLRGQFFVADGLFFW
jgi:phosphatidate cytidylyltransferase